MDFLGELQRAVQNAPGNAVPPAGEHSWIVEWSDCSEKFSS